MGAGLGAHHRLVPVDGEALPEALAAPRVLQQLARLIRPQEFLLVTHHLPRPPLPPPRLLIRIVHLSNSPPSSQRGLKFKPPNPTHHPACAVSL